MKEEQLRQVGGQLKDGLAHYNRLLTDLAATLRAGQPAAKKGKKGRNVCNKSLPRGQE
jgi:hypothetical protein